MKRQTSFMIEKFILSVANRFQNCPQKSHYLVDLFSENIFEMDDYGILKIAIPQYHQIFNYIHYDFPKVYDQLVNKKEIHGFLVGNIHFLPLPEYQIQFRKNKPFTDPKNRKFVVHMLESKTPEEIFG